MCPIPTSAATCRAQSRQLPKTSSYQPGYSLGWSGQFESMQRAAAKLQAGGARCAVGIIVLLLFMNFRNLVSVAIILGTLPLALVGGYWLLYLLGYNQSIAVGAGFIALAGVAVEIGVLMLVYLDQAMQRQRDLAAQENRPLKRSDVMQAVTDGALLRVRPIIMTVASTIAGLLPIMLGSGTGSAVMRRIAAADGRRHGHRHRADTAGRTGGVFAVETHRR